MAATVTQVGSPMRRQTRGEILGMSGVIVDVAGDAAYDDDGYAITASSLGLRTIVGAVVLEDWRESTNENFYPASCRRDTAGTSLYVQALESTAAASPLADAGADNLSTYTCRLLVIGT